MHSQEIAPSIYWVGFVDWDVRDFHGYKTRNGTTYNAYLVNDEKIALIDAVKQGHGADLLAAIRERVDPARIEYVVSNHTEPDHSFELNRVLEAAPQARVIASEKGKQGLQRYYRKNWNFQVVKTGDAIKLGRYTLQFVNTPMLHWPDSMFTYIPEERILFSMDGFGQHLATNRHFDTENDLDLVMESAKVYYANILMHLGSIAAKTIKAAADLPIRMIAPSHGVIWTEHIGRIMAAYRDWSVCKSRPKALVIYDSMWHSTERMAAEITTALTAAGIEARQLRLTVNDLTTLATETLDTAAIIVGSPTLNNNLMPTVASFLTYIKGLRPKGKIGFVFGSYGWSGGAVAQAETMLRETGVELVTESVSCQFTPDEQDLQHCREAAEKIAFRIKNPEKTIEKPPQKAQTV